MQQSTSGIPTSLFFRGYPSKMKFLSYSRNIGFIVRILCLLSIVGVMGICLSGCYSFTGASVPPHLQTIQILTAEDESGFGNAQLREQLTQFLVTQFRQDNTFRLVQEGGHAVLASTITTITDQTATASGGEVERERKVTVSVRVLYEDRVKNRQIWDKTFSQFALYQTAEGLPARDAAVLLATRRVSEEILLAVVSGW